MSNKWQNIENNEENEDTQFEEFIKLYRIYLTGTTCNEMKLKIRISKIWDDLSMAKKRIYQEKMVNINIFNSHVLFILKTFNGILTKIA